MKPVKAWAICDEDGIQPDGVFKNRAEALHYKLIGNREWVVRVEVREVKPKRKRRSK